MNGHKEFHKSEGTGRRRISGPASFRAYFDGICQPIQSADPFAARYSHATERSKQRSFKRLLALFVRGSWLEVQRPNKTIVGGVTGTRPDLLHSTGAVAQQNQLVRGYVDGLASPSRNGLWITGIASIGLFALAAQKRSLMYACRTYEHPYKYVCRTWKVLSKYGIRSYLTVFCHFLSTPAVHHLELPSAMDKSSSPVYAFKEWLGALWPSKTKKNSALSKQYITVQNNSVWYNSLTDAQRVRPHSQCSECAPRKANKQNDSAELPFFGAIPND